MCVSAQGTQHGLSILVTGVIMGGATQSETYGTVPVSRAACTAPVAVLRGLRWVVKWEKSMIHNMQHPFSLVKLQVQN